MSSPQALSHSARINTHNDRLRETSRQRSVKKESSSPYIRQYNGEHNPKRTDQYLIAIQLISLSFFNSRYKMKKKFFLKKFRKKSNDGKNYLRIF